MHTFTRIYVGDMSPIVKVTILQSWDGRFIEEADYYIVANYDDAESCRSFVSRHRRCNVADARIEYERYLLKDLSFGLMV